jgi:hypothetical protein
MQEEQKGEEKKKEEKYRERCAGQVIFLSIFNFDTLQTSSAEFAGVRTKWVFHLLLIFSGFVAFTTDPFDASFDFLDLKIGS